MYQADTFDNGNSFGTSSDIAGTDDDGLYQTERRNEGGFAYAVAVENGIYNLQLNFARIWDGASPAGQRVFDIKVEDQFVFEGLDIAGAVGFNTALDLGRRWLPWFGVYGGGNP